MTQTQTPGNKPEPDLLTEIRMRVPLPENVRPERALSGVICALDQHVTGGESRHLFEMLPSDVQPLLAPCLVHRGEPAVRFGWDGLVQRVADHLDVSRREAEGLIPGVMVALSSRLPSVAVKHVASQLPEDMKHLWLGPKEVAERLGRHDVVEEVENELPPGVGGKRAVAAVMCTLSDRLPLAEARHLVHRLPSSVQDEMKPCLRNRTERPDPLLDLPAFLARVRSRVPTDDPEAVTRVVFHAVQHYLAHRLIHHIHGQLPKDLQRLWANP